MANEVLKTETNVILAGSGLNYKMVIWKFLILGLDYAIVHGTDFTGSTFEGKRSTEDKNKRNFSRK